MVNSFAVAKNRGRSRAVKLARLFPPSVLFAQAPGRVQAVALTFDDGPHPEHTARILDTLRDHGAHATFFAVGRCARLYPQLIKRMVVEGHTVGNHTDTHADLSRLGLRQAWRECHNAQRTLEDISGRRVRYLRPPWGHMALSTVPIALASRMTLALWSLDSLDYSKLTASELVERLQTVVPEPGDVLLFHDDDTNTVQALPLILSYLQDRGLACVSLDELFT